MMRNAICIFYGKDVIKSSDENAIEKLQEKVDELRETQEQMKEANKAIRLKDTEKGNELLRNMGYTDEQITDLRTPDFCGRLGFPNYALTNNNANMGFWPKNEVIQYAVEQRIPICSVYGTPYQDKKGNWYFTGEQRTGCCVCGFGCHLEPVPNRLQRLRTSDNDKHRRMCEGCLQIKNHGMTYEQALNYAGIPTEEVQEDE